jgi:hypothetical protein
MNKQRVWVTTAWVGCVMVVIAILAVAAVSFDKDLVKPLFLEYVTGGVMVGGLIVFIAAWFLPDRKNWRGITLMVWGLIAVTSPWFGLLFLVPWAVVGIMLPLVIAILVRQSRIAKAVPVIAVS